MKNKLIAVDTNNIPIIEWEGKRVITLAMIDKLHGKADGSSRVTISNHRSKFILGRDAYLLKGKKEIKALPNGAAGRRASSLWLITELGYLIFIKIIRGDLAWETQKSALATYFSQNKAESYQYDN